MKLPDSRYSADREFCGHETAMYIPRFCGEWLRDATLWPDRAGNQAPPAHTRQAAIASCVAYEESRQRRQRVKLKHYLNQPAKMRSGIGGRA